MVGVGTGKSVVITACSLHLDPSSNDVWAIVGSVWSYIFFSKPLVELVSLWFGSNFHNIIGDSLSATLAAVARWFDVQKGQ